MQGTLFGQEQKTHFTTICGINFAALSKDVVFDLIVFYHGWWRQIKKLMDAGRKKRILSPTFDAD
jgi:hypothetical protein